MSAMSTRPTCACGRKALAAGTNFIIGPGGQQGYRAFCEWCYAVEMLRVVGCQVSGPAHPPLLLSVQALTSLVMESHIRAVPAVTIKAPAPQLSAEVGPSSSSGSVTRGGNQPDVSPAKAVPGVDAAAEPALAPARLGLPVKPGPPFKAPPLWTKHPVSEWKFNRPPGHQRNNIASIQTEMTLRPQFPPPPTSSRAGAEVQAADVAGPPPPHLKPPPPPPLPDADLQWAAHPAVSTLAGLAVEVRQTQTQTQPALPKCSPPPLPVSSGTDIISVSDAARREDVALACAIAAPRLS